MFQRGWFNHQPSFFGVERPGTLRFQSCVDVVNGHPIDGLFCCGWGCKKPTEDLGFGMMCQVRDMGVDPKIGGKPPKWMVYNDGKPY